MLLLQTKLYTPPLPPALVPRPHLLNRLTQGLNGKLTLVCAPAGSGKTTLLRHWLAGIQQQERRASVWLTLDALDNDLTRFFSYLIAALQHIAPDLGQTALAGLETQQAPNVVLFLTHLLNEIVILDTSFVLVLDDFHVITDPMLHEVIAFLLNYLPPHMHLVLSSRTTPPIALARLRAQGQVTQLRAADLCFTLTEATTFFNRVMRLDLRAADIELLEQRTEGWIAGLHLAAQALQGLDTIQASDFLASFAGDHQDIAGYLLEEVFHQQPEYIQKFLLHTCILERFCAPLCDVLIQTGEEENHISHQSIPSSQDILDALEQANLFLVPLDARHQWYRYHHLFTDVLRRQRGREASELHRRAASWFEQEGMLDEAVKHLLAAQDDERAAHLIEKHAERLFWERSGMLTLLHWLEQLLENVIRRSPRLCLTHAWILSEMHTDKNQLIASRLQDAALLLGTNEDASPSPSAQDEISNEVRHYMLAEKNILTARIVSQQGDTSGALLLCQQTLEQLPETYPLMRGIATAICAFVEHDITTVSCLLTQSIALCRTAGNRYFAALFTANLIEVLLVQGQLHRAERAFRRLLHFPEKHDGPEIGMMCVSVAMVYLERKDLQTAEMYLQEGIERCRPFDAWAGVVFVGLLRLARIRSLQHNIDGAYALLKEAEQFEERGRASHIPFPIPRLETAQAQLWLMQGNLSASLSWATDWRALAAGGDLRCSHEVEYLTLTRILIAQARKQANEEWANEARQLISSLLQFAQTSGRTGHVLEMYLLQALIDQMQGNMPLAFNSLQKALSLAEPEEYVCRFVDEGEPMAKLLREAVIKGIAPDYCTLLLAVFPNNEHTLSVSTLSSSPMDPLTKQEWKTLQLLASPLAIPQIAAELIVEVSTIRTHIKRIYSKLDVHTRIEAVQRAKELGILETK
jgi:LuxR family maltose regulon positive regulatory protein